MSTEHLTRIVVTEADAQRIWKGSSIVREEFPSPGALWHFVRAIASGDAKLFTR